MLSTNARSNAHNMIELPLQTAGETWAKLSLDSLDGIEIV